MTAEIATVRTAAEAARRAAPADLVNLDAGTVAAVTELLRAAGELARAQRPIVLHDPATYAPAVAAGTAAYGAHVRIPAPPARDETRDETPRAWRPALWGDKVLWFGCGAAASGVAAALLATVVGTPWALLSSAAGAALCPIGGAAINRAERARERS